jgi:two-component system response regulator HydG
MILNRASQQCNQRPQEKGAGALIMFAGKDGHIFMLTSVLVIDSDLGVLDAFKTSLSRWGFVVAGFASIAQGFEALKKEQPQALILDIQLPKPQSLSLLREAKKLYPSLPVITLTAYSTSFTEADALRAGADAYFVKPFDFNSFIRKLKTVTNGAMQNERMVA